MTTPCSVDTCERSSHARGWCQAHYRRWKTTGDVAPSVPLRFRNDKPCAVEGCDRPAQCRGWCNTHYSRWRIEGDPGTAEMRKRPRGEGWVSHYGYKVVLRNGVQQGEHRHVMEAALGRRLWPDENVHHINGDRLDNRIENLELWSTSQPAGQRIEDKLAWAREIIARYAAVMA